MHIYHGPPMRPRETMGLNVKLDAEETEVVLTRFIRDHVADADAKGVVLGLSSGMDSAVVASLAVRAIGKERVQPFFLPFVSTPEEDLEEARALADSLGLELQERPVDSIVEALVGTVGEGDRETVGNAAARARMMVLYAMARRSAALVLGTGNKSELLVGYFTKHGDGGNDLLPLGDLYKSQVRLLAEHLDLPATVLNKTPSAGLWQGQTDEGEIGIAYDILDRVLLGFELGLRLDEITSRTGVDEATVKRVGGMVMRSEHKRNMPRVCKIGIRSLTRDWRRSVTEGGEGSS